MLYGVSTCASAVFIAAPYGRYSSSRWGPLVPAKLGWMLQECPAFLIPAGLLLSSPAAFSNNHVHLILLSMFMFHYLYRSFVYPFFVRGKPTPVVIVLFAFSFCVYNGYLQGRYITHLAKPYPDSWLYTPQFLLGVSLWLLGWLINFHSDHVLRNLRKPGETGYKIPNSGMFRYVSAANYFGEMVEWIGFAIANWSLPSAAFAVFCCCFLGSRGYHHHLDYLKKFDTYPKHRKALIPFLL